MRLACLVAALLIFNTLCLAQEQHFATGPSYLQIQPPLVPPSTIATPSYSLPAAQEVLPAEGPSYLLPAANPMFARPIAPPTMSLQAEMAPQPTPHEYDGSEFEVINATPELPPQADLYPIFYGTPPVQEIIVSFRETAEERAAQSGLPLSIIQSGVVELTDAASLRLRGYGVTLPEAAAYWKTRKTSTRVYTNADIERLHARD